MMTRTDPPSRAPAVGRRLPLPLPELVDGGRWVIERASGDGRQSHVGLDPTGSGGTLRVPLGGGLREGYIRDHELGHIAWTPRERTPDHIPEVTMQHAEDARIGRRLAAVGIHQPGRVLTDLELEGSVVGLADREIPPVEVASLLLALHGTEDGELLASLVEDVDHAMPGEVERIWEETIGVDRKPRFARAVEAAELLLDRFGQPREDAPIPSIGHRPVTGSTDAGPGRWGEMEVVRPPLPLRLPSRSGGRTWRSTDFGVRLGDPSRLWRDGCGWRARRRSGGGAVLIDCSGSMDLSADELEALVTVNPAALVATYCGTDAATGRLHVVARGGRRAAPKDLDPPGRGNIIDGPALDFLAKQAPPRIWVSDGQVTGVGNQDARHLRADAQEIVARHGIRRVGTLADLLKEWGKGP